MIRLGPSFHLSINVICYDYRWDRSTEVYNCVIEENVQIKEILIV